MGKIERIDKIDPEKSKSTKILGFEKNPLKTSEI